MYLYNELSRVNNELVNMQRALAIQNQALQRAQVHLETRVRERTLELEQAREEAEQANAAKSEFLSRMSHELRTPLNSILGFAQIMEMDALDGRQAVRLGHIIKAGEQLLALIDQILDTLPTEAEREPVSAGPTPRKER